MDGLPQSWCSVPLSEIVEINPGVDKNKFRDDDEMPFVPMPAVEAETGRIDTCERRPFGKVKSGFTAFASGDVLFAKITPCMENGKMAVVPPLPSGVGFGTTEFHALRPTDIVDAKLVYYFVSSASVRHEAQHQMTGAVGQKRVPKRYLETKRFPLAPLNEQRRIVEKIETLFAQLDKGATALREVQKLLARYRQSVLKAAVTGQLTADWRAENAHRLEPGRDLLERILQTRRETWQGRGKYKEPAAPDTTELPEPPEGWVWATVDQLLIHLTSGSRDWKQYYGRGEGVFIMAQNVRPMRFDLSEKFMVDPPLHSPDAVRSEVRRDDILITIVGANTGDLCRFPTDDRQHYVCQSVALLRLAHPELSPFVEMHLSGKGAGRDQLEKFIYGAGRPHLSFEQLRSVVVPLPSREEQKEIMVRVDEVFERIKQIEDACETEFARSAALRQSILKDAFAGRLVPQDPADEPAADLLARIRKTRASAPREKRGNTQRKVRA